MTIPPQSARTATDHRTAPLREIVRRLQHTRPALVTRIAECAIPASPGSPSLADAVDDLHLWLDVLAGALPPAEENRRFRRLGQAYARGETRPEDAVAVQHTCVVVLRQLVAEQTRFTRPAQDAAAVMRAFDAVTRRHWGPAVTALTEAHRAARAHASLTPDADRGFEAVVRALTKAGGDTVLPALPGFVRAPLRWCLVSRLDSAAHAEEAARTLRNANPRTLAAAVDRTLIAYQHERPVLPDGFPPSGLAAVEDSPERAARHAGICAGLARDYGHPLVDTRQIQPLLPALDQGPALREEFLTTCLGPLYTDAQNAHLVQTLRAYLTHGLRSAPAARSLFIHRHTMTYRLRCIRELTRLDLDRPLHRLQAEVALFFLQEDSRHGRVQRQY
ncbi:helix-turn-helix domain-containing protein [Streptomyces sp. NPDC046939]|uniref:helix-turn-helix domain-containing protein n=1 Tax=Streptomyces sp. NPDC046939 TaxID=3155376 RepID=UPI003404B912